MADVNQAISRSLDNLANGQFRTGIKYALMELGISPNSTLGRTIIAAGEKFIKKTTKKPRRKKVSGK